MDGLAFVEVASAVLLSDESHDSFRVTKQGSGGRILRLMAGISREAARTSRPTTCAARAHVYATWRTENLSRFDFLLDTYRSRPLSTIMC